jgi:hypothetical protein
MAPVKHGHKKRGQRPTRTYKSWELMKRRCDVPKCKEYRTHGARGIAYCKRWDLFENFLADMGDCPPDRFLERKDNDGNYELSNCVWATRQEQNSNTRQNVFLVHDGRRQTLTAWAREAGISSSLLTARIRRLGWSIEKAISTPVIRYVKSS